MFDIFKPKARHRAGERSFKAFRAIWIGKGGFPEYVAGAIPNWEEEYQGILERCKDEDPVDLVNNVVTVIARQFVAGNEKAKVMALRHYPDVGEKDSYWMSGSFTIVGLLSHIVFAPHPPSRISLVLIWIECVLMW